MSAADLLLHAVVAIAAALQGITGIGFALLAGPAILILRDDAASLQVISILTLTIAVLLMPVVYRHVLRRTCLVVSSTAIAVMPVGLWLYSVASVAALKLGAGVLLALLLVATQIAGHGRIRDSGAGAALAGAFAGITGGALAMIGPPVSLYLAATGAPKAAARATVLAAFLPCYLVLIAGQAVATELGTETLIDTAIFLPALVAGTVAGNVLAGKVDERQFRRVVTVFLAATSAALIADGTGFMAFGG